MAPGYPKLKPDVKTTWLAKLRSGEYKQTTGGLQVLIKGESQFCCLGVLCDITDKSKWLIQDREKHVGTVIYKSGDYDRTGYVPDEVLAAAFDTNDRDWASAAQRYLARLNDEGKTFAQIADWIEANL